MLLKEDSVFYFKPAPVMLERKSISARFTLPFSILRNSVGSDYDGEDQESLYKILRKIFASIVVLFSPLYAKSLAS